MANLMLSKSLEPTAALRFDLARLPFRAAGFVGCGTALIRLGHTTVNAIFRNSLILGLLVVVGCATDRPPRIVGCWQVSGTDNVVTLAQDHSARLTSDGKTISGRYRMVAPDILILTVSGSAAQSRE